MADMASENKLKEKEEKALEYIKIYYNQNHLTPTVRELQTYMGYNSTASAHHILKALKDKGYLKNWQGQPRSYQIVEETPIFSKVSVPYIEDIYSSGSIIDKENVVCNLTIPVLDSIPDAYIFTYRINTDNLLGEHICKGDVVMVRKQDMASDGDKVLVFIGSDLQCRIYHEDENSMIRLESYKHPPIYMKKEDCDIVGVIFGLVRYMD